MSEHVVVKNGREFFDIVNFSQIVIEWFKDTIIYVVMTIYPKI